MKQASSRNPHIDAFRGISCAFVVFIHCPPTGMISNYIVSLARFAVPFFILVSGWFSHQATAADTVSFAKRKLMDAINLAAGTLFIYIIWNSLNSLIAGQSIFAWLYHYLNVETLFNLFVFNRALFINAGMYYLLMMIYVYLLFILIVKLRLIRFSVWLIPILLASNIIMGAVLQCPWYYSGNFLFTGLPFFLLGNRLRSYFSNKAFLPKWSSPMLLFGIILTFIETWLWGQIYCYFGTVLMAVSILLLCVRGKNSTHFNLIAAFGRKYSMAIFILHCGVRDTVNIITGYSQNLFYRWSLPVISIAVSTFIAFLYHATLSKLRTNKNTL